VRLELLRCSTWFREFRHRRRRGKFLTFEENGLELNAKPDLIG
jgi:hypothetical protein